ncbi:uncharacterized protein LOC135154844 [Lytechinus pictus]|uniref:uncharacterized protein LOC135154844 n=1 Tax=Lytechinus pictus TaxID=7653 RepID=UPI0030B9C8EE
MSLTVAEGENRTLVCKTNGSVKPPVSLEWDVSDRINVYDDLQENENVTHDGRLSVTSRTIVFTPLYSGIEEVVVMCRVANASFHHITTSIILRNEGTTPPKYVGTTPPIKHLVTTPEESNPSLTSDGEMQDNCALLHIVIYILGGSLGAMILGLVAVTVSYKCLQHNTDRAWVADMAHGVSVTAMHQKYSNHEPLYVNSTMTKPGVGGDPVLSRSDVVPKQLIQDAHEYMEMKPMSHTGVPPNHQASPPGNPSSLHPTQLAWASSLKGGSTSDAILQQKLDSCDGGYISCSGPRTFLPQQGIALESPDSVITTYL